MTGVEPSADACAAAARARRRRPRRARSTRVALEPAAYDLAVFQHSLEHTAEPLADLERVGAALAPGGVVVVTVPNFGGWQARRFRDRWYHLDLPRHRTHFTERGLRLLLERAGLRVQRLATSTSSVGLPATLQYALAGRCLFPGGLGLRIASGLCVLTRAARAARRPDRRRRRPAARRRDGGPGGMSRPLKILIVAYFYPPQNITGARRPAALAKWLGRRGHEATVLTSRQAGSGPDPAGARITRTRDLLATRLNWRGDSLKVVTGASDATWDAGGELLGGDRRPGRPAASRGCRSRSRRRGGCSAATRSTP